MPKKVQARPLICVRDVPKSSRWYQKVLGCTSGHGGDEYEMLMDGRTLVLQLHAWDQRHHHEPLGDPKKKPYGNGAALWFHVDDFKKAVTRIKRMKAKILTAPHINPNADHWEIWLRDPDGYLVILSGD